MNFLAKVIFLSTSLFVCQNIGLYAGNRSNSIDKFIFIENKLIKSQEANWYSIIQDNTIKYLAPVAASFVISRSLEHLFWDDLISQEYLSVVPGGNYIYQFLYKKINNLVFIILSPLSISLVSKFYKGRGADYVKLLEQFIKRWEINKFNTPSRFYRVFDNLYSIFLKNKKLNISQHSAKSIIANIAQETISFIEGNQQNIDTNIELFLQEASKKQLTDEAKDELGKEIEQLQRTTPNSMQSAVLMNHIKLILSLPWHEYTQDNINIKRAKEVLDEDHYGLKDVKERILDFLAVKSFKEGCKVPVLCLSGPPGVGKTSIAKSIAKCIGKKFFKVSLGGVNDESEIRGHRRTYVGAMPGRFIQAIVKTQTSNPLILLDEIDKISSNGKGDLFSALLEVLDTGQNSAFYDNYLGIHFDLSKVMFVATANYLDKIPKPLKDRMEVIELTGYNLEEKLQIAKRHLIPKAIKDSGLEGKGFELDDQILEYIIKTYAVEPGIREIERHVYKLCSKFARNFVEKDSVLKFCAENVSEFLGNHEK